MTERFSTKNTAIKCIYIQYRSVAIAFGFIGEFILRRSDEVGHENWGKAISCDPPQHFPDIKYYWSRDYFPNFVEEDRRVMVSNHQYYILIDNIDCISTNKPNDY